MIEETPSIEPITGNKDFTKEIQDEAFMNEPVVIRVYPTTDANASPYAVVSVNGDRCVIGRDVNTQVKRKHVEVLARMKETRYSQNLNPNSNGEVTTDALRGHTALAYPFLVVRDDNPKGMAWIDHILGEAG